MQCDKCSKDMEKKNEHESGNIKFQRYACEDCHEEKHQAVGLTGGMPEE